MLQSLLIASLLTNATCALFLLVEKQSLQMWLKSDRGEIEVYLCPEDDSGSASPRSASSIDEGKGESVSAGSTFDSKSALEAATRSPDKQQQRTHYTKQKSGRCPSATHTAVLRPEESEAMKYAFISEDDDLGTIGSTKSYLMMSDGEVATSGTAHQAASASAPALVKQQAAAGSSSTQSNITPAANVHNNSVYLTAPSVGHQQPMILLSSTNSSPTGSLPFLSLEPPLSEEDYNFALEASEGITDLFDEDLLLTSS